MFDSIFRTRSRQENRRESIDAVDKALHPTIGRGRPLAGERHSVRQTAGGSAVDFSPVADLHYGHQFHRVVDLVENAVVALANAVLLRAAQLLATVGSWVAREQLNLRDNTLAVGLPKISDLLGRRTLDFESIAFHVA